MDVKFSIITPVFNGEKYIKKCIENIANVQYDLNLIEHIVIDDGSTDNTKQVCQELVHKYKHLKFYSKSNNHWGSVINYVKHNKLAKGDYILICDSDDLIRPKAFKAVDKKVHKYNFLPDLFAGSFCLWNGKHFKIKIHSYYLKSKVLLKNKKRFYSPLLLPFSAYIKKDIFYDLPDLKEKVSYQDNILYANAFYKSETMAFIHKTFTWYWKKRENNSMSNILTQKGIEIILENLKYFSKNNMLDPFVYFLIGFPKIRKYLKQNNIKFEFINKKIDTTGFPIIAKIPLRLIFRFMIKKFIK